MIVHRLFIYFFCIDDPFVFTITELFIARWLAIYLWPIRGQTYKILIYAWTFARTFAEQMPNFDFIFNLVSLKIYFLTTKKHSQIALM